ncbi:MAG TPA: hypothetical protein VEA44_04575 [Caulobacter sp.]|nr:hypothetical protein [Caulobacter sp.]
MSKAGAGPGVGFGDHLHAEPLRLHLQAWNGGRFAFLEQGDGAVVPGEAGERGETVVALVGGGREHPERGMEPDRQPLAEGELRLPTVEGGPDRAVEGVAGVHRAIVSGSSARSNRRGGGE